MRSSGHINSVADAHLTCDVMSLGAAGRVAGRPITTSSAPYHLHDAMGVNYALDSWLSQQCDAEPEEQHPEDENIFATSAFPAAAEHVGQRPYSSFRVLSQAPPPPPAETASAAYPPVGLCQKPAKTLRRTTATAQPDVHVATPRKKAAAHAAAGAAGTTVSRVAAQFVSPAKGRAAAAAAPPASGVRSSMPLPAAAGITQVTSRTSPRASPLQRPTSRARNGLRGSGEKLLSAAAVPLTARRAAAEAVLAPATGAHGSGTGTPRCDGPGPVSARPLSAGRQRVNLLEALKQQQQQTAALLSPGRRKGATGTEAFSPRPVASPRPGPRPKSSPAGHLRSLVSPRGVTPTAAMFGQEVDAVAAVSIGVGTRPVSLAEVPAGALQELLGGHARRRPVEILPSDSSASQATPLAAWLVSSFSFEDGGEGVGGVGGGVAAVWGDAPERYPREQPVCSFRPAYTDRVAAVATGPAPAPTFPSHAPAAAATAPPAVDAWAAGAGAATVGIVVGGPAAGPSSGTMLPLGPGWTEAAQAIPRPRAVAAAAVPPPMELTQPSWNTAPQPAQWIGDSGSGASNSSNSNNSSSSNSGSGAAAGNSSNSRDSSQSTGSPADAASSSAPPRGGSEAGAVAVPSSAAANPNPPHVSSPVASGDGTASSDAIIQQLVALVQSQAAQIKDLRESLASARGLGGGAPDNAPIQNATGDGSPEAVGLEPPAVESRPPVSSGDGGKEAAPPPAGCVEGGGSAADTAAHGPGMKLAESFSGQALCHDSVQSLPRGVVYATLSGGLGSGGDAAASKWARAEHSGDGSGRFSCAIVDVTAPRAVADVVATEGWPSGSEAGSPGADLEQRDVDAGSGSGRQAATERQNSAPPGLGAVAFRPSGGAGCNDNSSSGRSSSSFVREHWDGPGTGVAAEPCLQEASENLSRDEQQQRLWRQQQQAGPPKEQRLQGEEDSGEEYTTYPVHHLQCLQDENRSEAHGRHGVAESEQRGSQQQQLSIMQSAQGPVQQPPQQQAQQRAPECSSLWQEVSALWQRLSQLEAAAAQQHPTLPPPPQQQRAEQLQPPHQQPQPTPQERPQEEARERERHHTSRVEALWRDVADLRRELRRHEESSREALDQVAKGMEHVAACMLSALMPAAAPDAVAAGAAAATEPLPSQQDGCLSQPQLLGGPIRGGGGGLDSGVESAAASPRRLALLSGRSGALTSAGGSPSGGGAGRSASPPSYDGRRQLRMLQHEMRRMRAVMAAQVVVAAATGHHATSGGGRAPGRGSSAPRRREGLAAVTRGGVSARGAGAGQQDAAARSDGGDVAQPQQQPEPLSCEECEQLRLELQQLQRDFLELRSGEALMVEAQEALVDLVYDMRRDLDEQRTTLAHTLARPGIGGAEAHPDALLLAPLPSGRQLLPGDSSFLHGAAAVAVTAGNSAAAAARLAAPPPTGSRESARSVHELCSAALLADDPSPPSPLLTAHQEEQQQPWQEPHAPPHQSLLSMQQQLQDRQQQLPVQQQLAAPVQAAPDQISEVVAVIQTVNSMLTGSLSQAISQIQSQGEEIEELKRCVALVAGSQQRR